MFVPIHMLPRFDHTERDRFQNRWEKPQGQSDHDRILTLIRAGAGEDFLQRAFERGQLTTIENMWDLRGIKIHSENLDFPPGDSFEAIDFSYANFYHTTFRRA